MQPAVTLVLLNWNGKHWLQKFLPTLLKTQYHPLYIRLVDNNSSDGSVQWVKEHFPEITCIELDDNYGFAEGNNKGIEGIDTPYIGLINTDVEVSPQWLTPLVAYMEAHPDVAVVQPLLLNYPNKAQYDLGAAGGVIDPFGYTFNRGRIFFTFEQHKNLYPTSKKLFWASGACMLIRKKVIDQIGLFDPVFFAHMEEIDFCWRCQRAGYKIACVVESTVFHVGGGTLPHHSPKKLYLNYRNNLFMLTKNLPTSHLPILLIRLLLDGISALFWTIKERHWIFLWQILKAHIHFYKNLPYLIQQRKNSNLPFLSWRQLNGVYPHSILWKYFIEGKKTFHELQWDISSTS